MRVHAQPLRVCRGGRWGHLGPQPHACAVGISYLLSQLPSSSVFSYQWNLSWWIVDESFSRAWVDGLNSDTFMNAARKRTSSADRQSF